MLGLPDVTKHFYLCVNEHRGITKGVLIQTLGPRKGLVAYLSKKLDPVATGWPPCFCIIVAVVMLVKDADKLTLGQNITTAMPHALNSCPTNG